MKLQASISSTKWIFISIFLLFSYSATAQFYWTGESSNNWSDAGNWRTASGSLTGAPGIAPYIGSNAIIDGSITTAFFSSIVPASVNPNKDIYIDVDISPGDVSILNYGQIISPSTSGRKMTLINGDFSMGSTVTGAFNQEDMDIIVNGTFALNGGWFNTNNTTPLLADPTLPNTDATGDMTVTGNFSINSSGIFTSTQSTLILSSFVSISGTFNHNNGTVSNRYTDTSGSGNAIIGSVNFYDFILDNIASDKVTASIGDFIVENSIDLNQGEFQGNINIVGEGSSVIINSNSASYSSGELIFNAGETTPQTLRINGASPNVFNGVLTLTNQSYVQLLSPVTLDDGGEQLDLQGDGGGILNTNSNTLTFGKETDFVRTNRADRNFIIGNVTKIFGLDERSDFTFPLGSVSEGYQPLEIQNSTNFNDDDSFTASFIASPPPTPPVVDFADQSSPTTLNNQLIELFGAGYWNLTRDFGSTLPQVTLEWNNDMLGLSNTIATDVNLNDNVVIASRDAAGAGDWFNNGGASFSLETPGDETAGSISNETTPTAPITAIGDASTSFNTQYAIGFSETGQRYWVGKGTTNWSDEGSWGILSGGTGGFAIPTANNNVIFDGVDANANNNCNINVPVNVLSLEIQNGYSGTITLEDANAVTVGDNGYTQAGGTFAQSSSSGLFSVGGSGDFSLSAGSFTLGSGGFTANNLVNVSGGTFNAGTGTITTNGDVAVSGSGIFNAGSGTTTTNGNVTISGTASFTATTGTWNARANISLANTATFLPTTNGTVVFNGASAQDVDNVTPFNNVTINKTGTGTDNNVDFSGGTTIHGVFTITDGQWASGNIDLKGDLSVSANATASNASSTLTLSSSTAHQTITTDPAAISWLNSDVIINNTFGNIILSGGLTLDRSGRTITLTDGNIVTSAGLLTIGDGVTISGGSVNSFIDGPLTKIGNDAFVFHIGKSSGTNVGQYGYHRLEISDPGSNVNDAFTAEYFAEPSNDNLDMYTGGSNALISINTDSYWTLTSLNANSAVNVTLSWNGGNFPLGSTSDVTVAGYDGNEWRNHGRGTVSGDTNNGDVESNNNPESFSLAAGTAYELALGIRDAQVRYWTGNTGNGLWSDVNNWSLSSGGSSIGATVPTSSSNVRFDGATNPNGSSNVACNIDVAVDIESITINGYTGTITQGNNNVTIGTGGFSQNNGAFTAVTSPTGTNPITINGSFTSSGGTFNAGDGNINFGGNATFNGGTFNGEDGELIFYQDGTFTSGNFNAGAGAIVAEGTTDATFYINQATSFQNFTISKNSGIDVNLLGSNTVLVTSQLTIEDGIWQSGNINLSGNLDLGANMGATGNGSNLTFSGSNAQAITVNSSATSDFNHNIIINKPSNNISLSNDMTLDNASQTITFTNGDLVTNSHTLIVGDGVSTTGAADDSHIVGTLTKVGDDDFTFPLGNGTMYKPLTITANAIATRSTSDSYTVQYDGGTTLPTSFAASATPVTSIVNNNDSWIISGTTSDREIQLPWNDNFCNLSLAGGLDDVIIARADNATTPTEWNNEGRELGATGTITGASANGFVVTEIALSSTPMRLTIGSQVENFTFYWTGAANSNWNDSNNWSANPGGCPTGAFPNAATHTAVFDGNGLVNCDINISPTLLKLEIQGGYTNAIALNTNTLIIGAGNFIQNDGTFNGGSGVFDLDGDWLLNGGTFNASSATSNFGGNLSYTGGIFDDSDGSIIFDGTLNQTLTLTFGALTFYDVTINKSTSPTDNLIVATNTLAVDNDLTITNGGWTTGNMTVGRNLTIANTANDNQGSGSTLTFNGTNAQQMDLTGAEDKLDASIIIDKTGGTASLVSNLIVDGTNQNITVNAGSFTASTGTTVELSATTPQQIGGTGGNITLENLTINKTSNEVSIDRNISTNNNLTFTSGNINLNNGNILLGTTGSLVNEADASRIYGIGGYVEATRDITADQLDIAGLGIDIALNGGTALGTTIIRRGHAPQEGVSSHFGIARYFDIDPSNTSDADATVSIEYYANENGQTATGEEDEFVLWSSTDLSTPPPSTSSWDLLSTSILPTTVTNPLSATNQAFSSGQNTRYTISSLLNHYLDHEKPIIDLNGSLTTADNDLTVSSVFGNEIAISAIDATITDNDDTMLEKVVITITSIQAGESITVASAPVGLTVTSITGGIELVGPATIAQFEAALDLVRYTGDPSLIGTNRSITFEAYDRTLELNSSATLETSTTTVNITSGIGAAFHNHLLLNGTGAVNVSNIAPIASLTQGTIELWFRADNVTPTQTLLAGSNGGNNIKLYISGGDIIYENSTGGSLTSTVSVLDNTWYHVAIVHDESATPETRMYVNGDVQGTTADVGFFGDITPSALTMGALNTTEIFTGRLEEVRIWSSLRTGNEIRGNRSSKLADNTPNLIAYWNFDRDDNPGICPIIQNTSISSSMFGILTPITAGQLVDVDVTTSEAIPNTGVLSLVDQINLATNGAINTLDYTFPANSFSVTSGVTYSAFYINGATETDLSTNPLSWLTFDASNRRFFNNATLPATIGEYRIRVEVEETSSGSTASDVFTISIGSPEISVIRTNPTPTATLVSGTSTEDFGNVLVNSSSTLSFEIRNLGNRNLIFTEGCQSDFIQSIDISGSTAFSEDNIGSSIFNVVNGTPATFDIDFSPASTGTETATVTILTNDPNNPIFTFNIQGTGITPEINLVESSTTIADGDPFDLGTIQSAGPDEVVTFTIQNATITNAAPLVLTGTSPNFVTISGDSEFTISAQPSVSTIGTVNQTAVSSTTFTVTFNPGATLGNRTATIQIPNNDLDEGTYDISLTANVVSGPVVDLDDDDSSTITGADYAVNTTGGATVKISHGPLVTSDNDIQTITISIDGYVNGQEVLGVDNPTNVSSDIITNFDAASGVFTLSRNGSATPSPAQYTAALNEITYTGNASLIGSSKVIRVVANDGTFASNEAIATINLNGAIIAGFGEGLTFNGNDYINLSNHAAAFSGFNAGTIEAWIKAPTTANATHVIFAASNANQPGDELRLMIEDNRLKFIVRNENIGNDDVDKYISDVVVNDDTWHHVAITHNGTDTKMYVDGTLQTTDDIASKDQGFFSNVISGINRISIGRNVDTSNPDGEWFFVGEIDEVRVWSVARNQIDIANSRRSQLIGNETELQGYWNFDEVGNCLDVIDFSTNKRHGARGSLNASLPTFTSTEGTTGISDGNAIIHGITATPGIPLSLNIPLNTLQFASLATYAISCNGVACSDLTLNQTPTSLTISGTPATAEILKIALTGTVDGASATDVFTIEVGQPTLEVTEVSPTSVTINDTDTDDFGGVALSNIVTHTYRITNSGTRQLTLYELGCSSTISESFNLTGSSDFSISLPSIGELNAATPSEFVEFSISFNPTTGGAKTAQLEFQTNVGTFTLNLTGEGSQPGISVSNGTAIANGSSVLIPNVTDFGTVSTGTIEYTFTIENSSSAPLNLIGSAPNFVEVTGAQAADFVVTQQPNNVVPALGSETFRITFTPGGLGERRALVRIPNSSPSNPFTFVVGGQGEFIDLNVSGNNIPISAASVTTSTNNFTNFGSIVVDGGTQDRIFKLTNNGTNDLVITTIGISGTDPGDFTLTPIPAADLTLSSGTTRDLVVSFDPSTIGSRVAQIDIISNDITDPTFSFAIEGIGTAPQIVLQGDGNDIIDGSPTTDAANLTKFGNALINDGSVIRSFDIVNNGNANLSLTGTPIIAISGPDAAEFSVENDPSSIISGGGGKDDFQLRFSPTTEGVKNAIISISHNVDATPYTFAISAQGVNSAFPVLSVSTTGYEIANNDPIPSQGDELFMGITDVSTSIAVNYVIRNNGTANLELTAVGDLIEIGGANPSNFRYDDTNPPNASIAPGGFTTFTIFFEPDASLLRTAIVTIETNDATQNPFKFGISGFGGSAPTPVDDVVNIIEEQTEVIDVLTNDTDPAGLSLSLTRIVTAPGSGVASIVGTEISYTPQPNFNGTDLLTYEVCNNPLGLCAIATVNITVTPDSDTPVAFDDVYKISINEEVLLNVQSNDIDPDGTGLVTTIVTSPDNGNAIVQSGTNILYSPNAGYLGVDKLEYEVCNGAGLCDLATILIEIFEGPIARDDEAIVDEDQAVVITVLANDEDPLGSALEVGIIRFSNGIIRINSAQQIIYTPELEFSGKINFGYQITNDRGEQDTATVYITVNAVNDPPTVKDTVYTLNEDTAIQVALSENAIDPEGSPLQFLINQPGNGSALLTGTTLNYRPNANFNGIDTLSYQVCDEMDTCTVGRLVFNVLPTDDAPVAFDDEVNVDASPKKIAILENDFNPDNDSLTITILTPPSKGNAVVIDNVILYLLDNNATGIDELRYQICNNESECSIATVTLTLQNFNELPIARNIEEVTSEGIPLTISLFDYASDPEGQRISFEMLSNLIDSDNSTYTLSDGILNYIPNQGFIGFDTLFYQACDPIGCSEARIRIRVTPSDGSPFAGDDVLEAFAGVATRVDVLENDLDPTNDPLTVTLLDSPLNGLVNGINSGEIEYLANSGFEGLDSLTYQVCDPSGLCDTATVRITVSPTTAPPVATDDTQMTHEDTEVVINVQENDNDPDMDKLITTIVRQPSFGRAFVINEDSINYLPNKDFPNSDAIGFDIITYRICDPSGQCDEADITIEVAQVNDPPIAKNDLTDIREGGQIVFDVLSNDEDPEGDELTFEIISMPANGMANNTNDHRISYIPNDNYIGIDALTYRVCDNGGLCDEATFTIQVISDTGPPVAANDDIPAFDEDTESVIINPVANDIDPDNEAMTARILTESSKGSIEPDSDVPNQFIFYPFANANGLDQLQYEVCDINNDCDTAFIFIDINPINDAPIAVDDTENVTQTAVGFQPLENDIEVDGIEEKNSLDLFLIEFEPGFAGRLGTAIVTGQSIFYSPQSGREGVDSLQYVICDDFVCDTAWIRINVSIPLNPPVADNDSYTIDVAETLVTRDFINNDRDRDNNLNELDIRIIQQPHSGEASMDTAVVEIEGENVERVLFRYTPNDLFTNGVDSIKYRIGDLTLLYDTATIYITVREFVESELIIYNGFSPDGDGINDRWQVFGLQYFAQNKVKVMNRWGNIIYEEEGYDNVKKFWDGKFQNNAGFGSEYVPEGTYFYEIDLGNGSKPKTGFLEVKRQ